MMNIGIVGAGVAGCHLAYRLAKAGLEVKLFDPRTPWEKPCGGGLTAKVFTEFPEVADLGLVSHSVDQLAIVSPSGRRALVRIGGRIKTVSRFDLGTAMLSRATGAGAESVTLRVEKVIHQPPGWTLVTKQGQYKADFLVGADGATGIVRRHVSTRFEKRDMLTTYGYQLPGKPELPVVIMFSDEFQGYGWIFPRPQGYSAGIATQSDLARKDQLIDILRRFVEREFEYAGLEKPDFPEPYAAMLPCPYPEAWTDFTPSAADWALVGDAAGAVDPCTGEGIYWAFKSADILANSILESSGKDYPQRFMDMARPGIIRGSSMRFTLYVPRYLRLLGIFMMYSPYSRRIAREMIDGTQDYWTLKPRIAWHLPQVFGEVLLNRLLGKKGDL